MSWLLGKFIPNLMLEDLVINEEIGPYEMCLDTDDKEFSIEEEHNMNKFGI